MSRASYYRRRVDQQSPGEDVIRSETNSSFPTGGGAPGGVSDAPAPTSWLPTESRSGQESTLVGFEPPMDGVCEAEAAETHPKRRPGREPVELP